jgi:hypothetical protein
MNVPASKRCGLQNKTLFNSKEEDAKIYRSETDESTAETHHWWSVNYIPKTIKGNLKVSGVHPLTQVLSWVAVSGGSCQ